MGEALVKPLSFFDAEGLPRETAETPLVVKLPVAAKQVRHDLNVGVACVVEARQAEAGLHRFQQRVAVVVVGALNTVAPKVRLDREHHEVLVLYWI